MGKNANTILTIARGYLGCKESNGSHKKIIDLYNSHKPLARSYKVKYTDSWCATFVSACAIKANYTDIIPTECSCNQMIKKFQNMGRWTEDDGHVPHLGDVIFYDWQDNGVGDCKGTSEHVGYVEKVENGKITVIEGNKSDAVARRVLNVNGRYIRGFGCPAYDNTTHVSTPTPTQNNNTVKSNYDAWVADLQAELNRQYNTGLAVDGLRGPKTLAACPLVRKGAKGNITRLIQKRLNSVGFHLATDGIFGSGTYNAVNVFQKNRGLYQDGKVGKKTWDWLLEGTKM